MRARTAAVDPPSPDDTQEVPVLAPGEPKDPEERHLELATEYMVRPLERDGEADVKPPPDLRSHLSLEETLPGIPAPIPAAPVDLESTLHAGDAVLPAAPEEESGPVLEPADDPTAPTMLAMASGSAGTDGAAPPVEKSASPSSKGKALQLPAIPRRWLVAAALAGFALLTFFLVSSLFSGGGGSSEAEPQPPSPAPKVAAPAPAEKGSLFLDAVPWGKVASITGADGRPVPLPGEPFTPLYLQLPPGQYEVVISHPDAQESWTCSVRVEPGGSGVCRGEFELVDVLDYFKETGWWQ